jgi:hypothetical protein
MRVVDSGDQDCCSVISFDLSWHSLSLRWLVNGDFIWFDADKISLFSLVFSPFHLNLRDTPKKIHSNPSIYFSFRFGRCSLNLNFLFEIFISNQKIF